MPHTLVVQGTVLVSFQTRQLAESKATAMAKLSPEQAPWSVVIIDRRPYVLSLQEMYELADTSHTYERTHVAYPGEPTS